MGFLLVAKLLRPEVVAIDDSVLNSNLNLILQAINQTLSRNQLLSDISVVAAKAFESIVLLLNDKYDSKAHSGALLLLKSICQNMVRKLDKEFQATIGQSAQAPLNPQLTRNNSVPLRAILRSLLTCLQVFPSSFKQIVGSNRQSDRKRDIVSQLFEEITRVFLDRDEEVVSLSLRFLSGLFKSRDKSKVHFKEWVNRCLSNLLILVDIIRPRLFSESAD